MTAMTCQEYIRLRDEYEEALREWGKVMRLHDARSIDRALIGHRLLCEIYDEED